MAVDRCFQIAGKVAVERGRGSMFFRQTQGLGKEPDMRFGGTKHGHRPCLISDDDLSPGAHPCEHVSKVAGGFRFRDVDHMVSHAAIIPSFLTKNAMSWAGRKWVTSRLSRILVPYFENTRACEAC